MYIVISGTFFKIRQIIPRTGGTTYRTSVGDHHIWSYDKRTILVTDSIVDAIAEVYRLYIHRRTMRYFHFDRPFGHRANRLPFTEDYCLNLLLHHYPELLV